MIQVNVDECVGCGGCVAGYDGKSGCPQDAIAIVNSKAFIDQGRCIACKKCIDLCGLSAINDVPNKEKS